MLFCLLTQIFFFLSLSPLHLLSSSFELYRFFTTVGSIEVIYLSIYLSNEAFPIAFTWLDWIQWMDGQTDKGMDGWRDDGG